MSDPFRDTSEVIRRFNDAFQRHDGEALADLVAEDCVIESTRPAPDGTRYSGREECLAVWRSIATAPGTSFVLEDLSVSGERAIILWRHCRGEDHAQSVRGVNLMRVRAGRIVEALGYVKGSP